MKKTSHSHHPLPLHSTTATSIQPWLRDRYTALRAETGPRWQHTREVVVPVITDTSHKVRDELVPAAVQLSTRVAEEAMQRSAPLRAEVSDRAVAALAAARGQLSAAQLAQLTQLKGSHKKNGHNGHSHRKFWFISGAAVAGAALGTAAVLWQRSRYQAWVEDEAVQSAMTDVADPARLDDVDDASANAHAHAPSTGRHGDEHH